jgi:hypothetical protein
LYSRGLINGLLQLFNVIESSNSADGSGAHIEAIVQGINARGFAMSRKQVQNELERLSGEGTVFSGATDDFWMVNDGAVNGF